MPADQVTRWLRNRFRSKKQRRVISANRVILLVAGEGASVSTDEEVAILPAGEWYLIEGERLEGLMLKAGATWKTLSSDERDESS